MIKDSGTRREFETGAKRDMAEGKGRCDLMPLDVVGDFLSNDILRCIGRFQQSGDVCDLMDALSRFNAYEPYTMMLEVAKHFEEGAKKYGEVNGVPNWKLGIPVKCYIDSAVRHYLKWLRGDTDEPHDRAFVWNVLACWWTCVHKPELNDYHGADTPVPAEKHIKSPELCCVCAYSDHHCFSNENLNCQICPCCLGDICYCDTIHDGDPCIHYEKSLH